MSEAVAARKEEGRVSGPFWAHTAPCKTGSWEKGKKDVLLVRARHCSTDFKDLRERRQFHLQTSTWWGTSGMGHISANSLLVASWRRSYCSAVLICPSHLPPRSDAVPSRENNGHSREGMSVCMCVCECVWCVCAQARACTGI